MQKHDHDHRCEGHDNAHVHGPGCGHEPVEHEGHTDYRVGDHIHHVADDGCCVARD